MSLVIVEIRTPRYEWLCQQCGCWYPLMEQQTLWRRLLTYLRSRKLRKDSDEKGVLGADKAEVKR